MISTFFCIFQKKVVTLRGENEMDIMKTIVVSLDVFLGYSHYGSMGTDGNVVIEVSDEVAALLESLQEGCDQKLTDEVIMAAIEQGHAELQDLHDELMSRCVEQESLHWCLEEDDCIDESLEPAFYEDVENGEYEPEPDDEDDEDYDPSEPDYNACRDNYLAWVRSHTDDVWFMAERLGVDVGADYNNYSYVIEKIE